MSLSVCDSSVSREYNLYYTTYLLYLALYIQVSFPLGSHGLKVEMLKETGFLPYLSEIKRYSPFATLLDNYFA